MNTNNIKVWDRFIRIFHWSLAGLFALAYFTGDDFKPAVRPPVEGITYWDTWGATGK